MNRRLLFAMLLPIIVITCSTSWAQSPLDGLSTLRNFKAMRSSSADPNWENGNADARPIAPGQTLTLADLEGPGRIAHIWFTILDNERYYGKLLVLRMYWDGEEDPSVESPINDFFCQGHGMDVPVDSLPIRVTSAGRARNCYWPMPFGKSAKITITNEGKQPVHAMYWYIDWQKMDKLPEDTAYFHAQYRQEFPTTPGEDYLILDAEGKGHFVGCNLSVRQHKPSWWGEGDDRFYIDGEEVPSLKGTGAEDYFCDAWGIRKLDGLYYGFPITEGFNWYDRHTNYRFHIQDPIPFTKSLKMTIEHKGAIVNDDGSINGFTERTDDYSSVAYWYQVEPHKSFADIPPAEVRLYKTTYVECESMVNDAVATDGEVKVQNLPLSSGGAQLFYVVTEAPASLKVKMPVAESGDYVIKVQMTSSWDYGIYDMYFDGKHVRKELDFYSPDVKGYPVFTLGPLHLESGKHDLEFKTTGKNPKSESYLLGLDAIELIPVNQ